LKDLKERGKKVKEGKKSVGSDLNESISTNASEVDEESVIPPPSAPPRDLLSDADSKISEADFEMEAKKWKFNMWKPGQS